MTTCVIEISFVHPETHTNVHAHEWNLTDSTITKPGFCAPAFVHIRVGMCVSRVSVGHSNVYSSLSYSESKFNCTTALGSKINLGPFFYYYCGHCYKQWNRVQKYKLYTRCVERIIFTFPFFFKSIFFFLHCVRKMGERVEKEREIARKKWMGGTIRWLGYGPLAWEGGMEMTRSTFRLFRPSIFFICHRPFSVNPWWVSVTFASFFCFV